MVEPVSKLASRMAVHLDPIAAPFLGKLDGGFFQPSPDTSAARGLINAEIAYAAKVSRQSQLRNKVQ